MVRKQIVDRYGQQEAGNYDPKRNCFTFDQWQQLGYLVNKGEKAIKSFIVIQQKDKNGKVNKYTKTINLFYIRQVTKV